MKTENIGKGIISMLRGEFCERELEKEYRKQDISYAIKYIKPILLMLGIFFFLFIIPDFFVIQNKGTFLIILTSRLLFLALVLVFYFKLKNSKSYEFYYTWITVYEILAYSFFLFTLYFYENPNLFIQTYGIILIIMGIFLVPNRWIYTVLIAVFFVGGFLLLFRFMDNNYATGDKLAIFVYLVFVVLLSAIASLRTNFFKRTQYLQQKQLLKTAESDQLTGIYNRVKFELELNKIYETGLVDKQASMILLDIDNFKRINDEFGHLAGDKVLVKFAELFKSIIKEKDILARWGGEEFIVLLPETSLEEAVELAKKMKMQLSDYDFGDVKDVTCSYGVVGINEYPDKNSLIHKVDKLLYKAKDQGKNQVISQ
ncbi:MAG: GGDEF domain-containing protein [Clostridia bacterium]